MDNLVFGFGLVKLEKMILLGKKRIKGSENLSTIDSTKILDIFKAISLPQLHPHQLDNELDAASTQ